MTSILLYAVLALSALGILAAIALYFIAQKFKVIEDPRIDLVDEELPGANCGGCGYAGCRAFAEAIVKKGAMDGFNCPVGGNDLMKSVAGVMGLEAIEADPLIAVVRCSGSCENAPHKVYYDGPMNCAFAHSLSAGESGCQFGCLGCGDCVESCDFDAIHMNPETGLPEVNDKCVACGACVEACPRDIIELRLKGKKDKRIYVSCINTEKGGPAKKNCSVACIGCSKCFKVCPFEAITMKNNLAYIHDDKCKLCRKCVPECPTKAIHELNFPPPRVKKPKPEAKELPAGEKLVLPKTPEMVEVKKTQDKEISDKEKKSE